MQIFTPNMQNFLGCQGELTKFCQKGQEVNIFSSSLRVNSPKNPYAWKDGISGRLLDKIVKILNILLKMNGKNFWYY